MKEIKKKEYYNLSYQEFYEDKILLMEYELYPEVESLKIEQIQDPFYEKEIFNLLSAIINNKKYLIYNNKTTTKNHRKYVFTINIQIPDTYIIDDPSLNYDLNKIKQTIFGPQTRIISKNILEKTHIYGLDKPFTIFTYNHNVLLTWEEITDKSYLNFIINSHFNYLNQLLIRKYQNKIKLFTEYNLIDYDFETIEKLNYINLIYNCKYEKENGI